MRVVLTVDPYVPVPPQLYGGIERVVDFLVRGLVARGHAVTLLAHPESRTTATLVPYGSPPHTGWTPRLAELWQVGSRLWSRRHDFDLVHSFGRLAALVPLLPLRRLPKIQSYQRDGIPWRNVATAVRLAGNSIRFTGCSSNMYRELSVHGAAGGRWCTIYNGVDIGKYTFVHNVAADGPLVFLGRLERVKGVHHAIAIAQAAGKRLVIAGNRVETGANAGYFEQQIAPFIDGETVSYVGPVDDAAKNRLLGSSIALLMPVEWEEPFGIVMVEAMACGTPVIGFSRGSLPEVIRDGVNGYLCQRPLDAAAAVCRLRSIDRARVRADCEERFGDTAIVSAYERLYREMLG
ncbi:MAG TPA: glycosyltransferase [Candidatus Acidoferrales bacterium]|nr:glycosyltransferase [Candidatus Acidoferrales bacterium]